METGKRGAGRKQRSYDPEFKEAAVGRMLRGENVVALSRELNVARAVLYRWRDIYRAEGRAGLARSRGRPGPGQEVVRLEPADRAAARLRHRCWTATGCEDASGGGAICESASEHRGEEQEWAFASNSQGVRPGL